MNKINKDNMLIVHLLPPSIDGGVWSVIKELIEEQLKNGMLVGVFSDSKSIKKVQSIFDQSVMYFTSRTKPLRYFNQALGYKLCNLYTFLQRNNPDYKIIFHSHSTVPVGLFSRIKIIPLIVTLHGINTSKSMLSHFITKMILLKMLFRAKKIIGVSQKTTEYYNRLLHSKSLETVYNGYSLKSVKKFNQTETFRIGYAATIDDFKGWRYLVEAFLSLPIHKRSKMLLSIAGDGPLAQVKLLHQIIKDNPSSNIEYIGKVKDAGSSFIPFVNLIVLPSINEGLSMSLIESLGNSVPILATAVGGTTELLIDGVNGYYIKRDVRDIAQKIEYIFDNESLRKTMERKSKEIYELKFTSTIMFSQYYTKYQEIISTYSATV